jgi:hypothetical protein
VSAVTLKEQTELFTPYVQMSGVLWKNRRAVSLGTDSHVTQRKEMSYLTLREKVSGVTLHEKNDTSLFIAIKPDDDAVWCSPNVNKDFPKHVRKKILFYRTSYSIVCYIRFTKINNFEYTRQNVLERCHSARKGEWWLSTAVG